MSCTTRDYKDALEGDWDNTPQDYQDVLEGVRINASHGPVWACSKKQGQVMSYRPTRLFKEILRSDYGLDVGDGWVKRHIRLPFLNCLFARADYGEYFVRTRLIMSGYDLTSGEASALHSLLYSDEAREVLARWLHDQIAAGEIEVPYSNTLWEM